MSVPNELEPINQVSESQLTRRAVISGAALIAAAAVVPQRVEAQSQDAEGSRYSGDRPVASITRNVVETDSGKVSGYESGGIITFKGIPYAASTTGRNRFMPATKPRPWAGTRSALHWGFICPQAPTSTVSGRRAAWAHDDEAFMFQWNDGEPSEDCLSVNVWTPAVDSRRRPVMVWIHGGGFTTGSSCELASYDGENLARRGDVIVVSVNHRLGPLGFLNLAELGDDYARSGNVGTLDLIAALEWVKTNIGNFGGDASKVTIFGQSGGGGKVSTLMGMPAARGLFHRAVIQSSGAAIHQLSQELSRRTTAALLKELGITGARASRLHEISNEQILEASLQVRRGIPTTPQPGFGGWGPVVDEHDLPRHVWDPAAPQSSAGVPLMIGTVLNEMGNSVQMGDPQLEQMSMDEVKRRMAAQFPRNSDEVIAAISKAHVIHKPFEILAVAGGLPRRVSAVQIAGLKSQQGPAPVFLYKFAWQSPILDGRSRACHCSELPFVFFNSERCSSMTGGGPAPMQLAGRISDAWINFARTGDPNHPGLPQWKPFTSAAQGTMVFDTACELKTAYDEAEVAAARASAAA